MSERGVGGQEQEERCINLVCDLKYIMKTGPPVQVGIRFNNNIILDEEQQTWPMPGYCHLLKPWTFISPLVLELIHKAH